MAKQISRSKDSAIREVIDLLGLKEVEKGALLDPDWGPELVSDWDYTPTVSGAFFKRLMIQRSQP